MLDMTSDRIRANIGELNGAHGRTVDKKRLLDDVVDTTPGMASHPIVDGLFMEHVPICRLIVKNQHATFSAPIVRAALEERIEPGHDLRKRITHQVHPLTHWSVTFVHGFGEQADPIHRSHEVEELSQKLMTLLTSKMHEG